MNLKKKLMLGASSLAIACSAYNAQAMHHSTPHEQGEQHQVNPARENVLRVLQVAERHPTNTDDFIAEYKNLSTKGKAALNEYLGAIMEPDFKNPTTGKHAHEVIHESPELTKELRPGHGTSSSLMWGISDFLRYQAKEKKLSQYGLDPDEAEELINSPGNAPVGSPDNPNAYQIIKSYIMGLLNRRLGHLSENERGYLCDLLNDRIGPEIVPANAHEQFLAATYDQQRQLLFGGE